MAKVFLVGAGPGAADLVTLRAMRVLQAADVVLYDALVSAEVLHLAKPTARLIDVGKRCGRKRFTQEEINALLIQVAREAEIVVRLKGGDPMIFGRAAEEMDALRSSGIEFEVIPGITAACSAAAAAKISLTARGTASEVLLTTAHHCTGWKQDEPPTDGKHRERTVVIYMPGRDNARVYSQLRAASITDDVPCTIVSGISSEHQQVISTVVGSLRASPGYPAPSILIIGEVGRDQSNEIVFRNLRGGSSTSLN
ncbi:MAG TPA: uroporphyrinogen-III C-methyltransferase [Terriglobales bacterium]|nr:uroporphyrinogen-III C-methyltransferase [Terriglobales bacterium]